MVGKGNNGDLQEDKGFQADAALSKGAYVTT